MSTRLSAELHYFYMSLDGMPAVSCRPKTYRHDRWSSTMRPLSTSLAAYVLCTLTSAAPALAQTQDASAPKLPIRAVVVTMFEIGQDSGDAPGEFQTWVDQLPLQQTLPFPQGYRSLRYNPDKGV